MNPSVVTFSALLIIPISMLAQAPSQDQSADDLLLAVSTRLNGIDQTSLVTITTDEKDSSKPIRKMRYWVHYPAPSDTIARQTMLEMFLPSRSAGQKYWLWEDHQGNTRQWIYLPGSRSLKEIRRQRLGGNSGFNLNDLELSIADIAKHYNTILDTVEFHGREVIRVRSEVKPKRIRRNNWMKKSVRTPEYKRLFIDLESLLIVQIEFFNPRNRLEKRYTIIESQFLGTVELLKEMEVWDGKSKVTSRVVFEETSLKPINNTAIFRPGGK